jgi:hypothetical protein
MPQRLLLPAIALAAALLAAHAAVCAAAVPNAPPPNAGALATPVTQTNLDADAYAEWVDGAERSVRPADDRQRDRQPQWILWTTDSSPSHSGMTFGASRTPGPRHLRIGFKEPVTAGAVLVRGGVAMSVLKEGAAYPGDMADESQWVPAQRIAGRAVSREEGGRDNYLLWTLPAAAPTRALRFTHVAPLTEKDYAGWLGGAVVLPGRYANVAPQAVAAAGARQKEAARVLDEHTNSTWDQWSNVPLKGGDQADAVSAERPESLMLVWPRPVALRGLATLFTGFAEVEVQAYAGPADVHPREAPESAWKTIRAFAGLKNRYPCTLPADWLDFGRDVTTRALRLRITRGLANGGHPHTQDHPKDGTRVWVGEVVALSAPPGADLATAVMPAEEAKEHPPIAVRFTMPEDGWATLVIESADGTRVRNLLADTFFSKGPQTAWWDGSDDLARDPGAAKHGLYYIPTQFVAPGEYRVRGLWRKKVSLTYEFGVYTAGRTPWETADRTGGWLSNHTPPCAVLFVPDAPGPDGSPRPTILAGSYVSEGTAGLAWLDLDGVKWRGQNWVGGTWTGAPYLARDAGPKAAPGVYAYVAAAWEAGTDPQTKAKKGEIRLTGLTSGADKPIIKYEFMPAQDPPGNVHWEGEIGGLAVHNGVAAVSMPRLGRLLFVDVAAGRTLGEAPLDAPHGLAFDAAGRLLAASGKRVVRFASAADPARLPPPETVVDGLQQPMGLALDAAGNLYVSDRGTSHQVKVFTPAGKPLRTLGKSGAPAAGPYEPMHMNNPRGVTVDAQGRVWAAEEDERPKRVSVWNADGTLARAFYGPAEYGGGGAVDPQDKTRFYYAGMEFRLDWDRGTDRLANVYYRPGPDTLPLAFRCGPPQSAVYAGGKRYWHNAFNSNPTNGHGTAFIFADKGGIAVPVAACGRANEWDALKADAFASAWPAETDSKAAWHSSKSAFFIWTDLDSDGRPQPAEVAMSRAVAGGVTVGDDLSFVVARMGERAVRFAPARFTPAGAPVYDAAAPQVLVEAAQPPPSSGGEQALAAPGGWSIHTNAPKPFPASAVGGAHNGRPQWSYPSLWPGLHASHEAPVPDRPGMIIGHTRLLGGVFTPGKPGAGGEPLWMLNTNHGPVVVFTADGLFVAQLMQDMRLGQPWRMPLAQRGMPVDDLTPSDENFWPGVTRTAEGQVYMVAGRPNAVVRVDGLDTVRRLPDAALTVTADDLARAQDYFARAEAARQAAHGRGTLVVAIRKTAPTVDGNADDWAGADWADIDKRGTAAYFNSSSRPYDVTGAAAVAGDRLFAAWRTGDKNLLKNAGDVPDALFKTGGALDIMIGAAGADPKRARPVAGDVRLLVTQVGGKTRALVYRPVATGEKRPVPFASPWRTITLDRVDDVSDQVQLAGADGTYEISVPLAALGLAPGAGMEISADIGILRGDGSTTTQRVYWTNKATAIVADVPSEAELRPNLWGRWRFEPAKP